MSHDFTTIAAQKISAEIEEAGTYLVGAELSHGASGTRSFEVQSPTGEVYRVCLVPIPAHRSSEFKPEPTETQALAAPALSVGTKVRSGAEGPTYGLNGVVTSGGARGLRIPDRIWIRWEGNLLSNGYPEGHPVLERLQFV